MQIYSARHSSGLYLERYDLITGEKTRLTRNQKDLGWDPGPLRASGGRVALQSRGSSDRSTTGVTSVTGTTRSRRRAKASACGSKICTIDYASLVYAVSAETLIPLLPFNSLPVGVCSRSQNLVDVLPTGRIIFEDTSFNDVRGDCSIQRGHVDLIASDPDGTLTTLSQQDLPAGPALAPGGPPLDPGVYYNQDIPAGDQRAVAFSSNRVIRKVDGAGYEFGDVTTGETGTFPYAITKRIWELSRDAHVLSTRRTARFPRTRLYTNIKDFSQQTSLNRPGHLSFFHFCGDHILEITHKGTKFNDKLQPNYWRLALRDTNGSGQGRLTRTLIRGTDFTSCDDNYALFEVPLSKRSTDKRTVVVPLTPSS